MEWLSTCNSSQLMFSLGIGKAVEKSNLTSFFQICCSWVLIKQNENNKRTKKTNKSIFYLLSGKKKKLKCRRKFGQAGGQLGASAQTLGPRDLQNEQRHGNRGLMLPRGMPVKLDPFPPLTHPGEAQKAPLPSNICWAGTTRRGRSLLPFLRPLTASPERGKDKQGRCTIQFLGTAGATSTGGEGDCGESGQMRQPVFGLKIYIYYLESLVIRFSREINCEDVQMRSLVSKLPV